MVKFLATRDGRVCLGLVLTKANLDRLMQDEPILLMAEEMKLPQFKCNDIAIIYAETEEKFEKDMRERGFISSETRILADPSKQ